MSTNISYYYHQQISAFLLSPFPVMRWQTASALAITTHAAVNLAFLVTEVSAQVNSNMTTYNVPYIYKTCHITYPATHRYK